MKLKKKLLVSIEDEIYTHSCEKFKILYILLFPKEQVTECDDENLGFCRNVHFLLDRKE